MKRNGVIWKDVIGYEGTYLVSKNGEIKSLKRNPKILACNSNNHGYKQFRAFDENANKKVLKVHRQVAKAFIDNPMNKEYVNHINGLKYDNRVENLEWVTASENQKHAYSIGLKEQPNGCNHANSKISDKELNEIRELLSIGLSQEKIALKFNIHQGSISRIKLGKTYI